MQRYIPLKCVEIPAPISDSMNDWNVQENAHHVEIYLYLKYIKMPDFSSDKYRVVNIPASRGSRAGTTYTLILSEHREEDRTMRLITFSV